MESSKLHIVMITCCITLVLFGNIVKCDINKDKEKCANILVGLAPCLAYVSGESNVPPIDCCTGFKQVLQKSPECVCILVKDRNDPSLGFSINATRALGLPTQCHVPSDSLSISDCPSLLHLAPNSPDAKVFEDFANIGKKSNGTTTAPAPAAVGNASASSAGRRVAAGAAGNSSNGLKIRNGWFGIGTVAGLVLIIFVHVLPNF